MGSGFIRRSRLHFDGPHATPPKTRDGPVLLGISNLASGRLDLRQTEHLSDDDYVRWTRRVTPRPNDIVFSYETRLGEAALIPKGLRACLGRRMGLLRPREADQVPFRDFQATPPTPPPPAPIAM